MPVAAVTVMFTAVSARALPEPVPVEDHMANAAAAVMTTMPRHERGDGLLD